MKNTPSEGDFWRQIPWEVQKKRVAQVFRKELTRREQETLIAICIEGKTLTQLAREQGIHKATVCRTKKRALKRMQRFLQY